MFHLGRGVSRGTTLVRYAVGLGSVSFLDARELRLAKTSAQIVFQIPRHFCSVCHVLFLNSHVGTQAFLSTFSAIPQFTPCKYYQT